MSAPLTPDTLRWIHDLAQRGFSERAIANDLGWTQERLRQTCTTHGIELTPLLTPRAEVTE